MEHYVDLHAHFLPGLDDGARTPEMALAMVNSLAALGFKTVHATPHQRAGRFMPSRADIDRTFDEVRTRALIEHATLTMGLAAENFWDEVFHQRLSQGGLPCYPGDKAFLFEVDPQHLPSRIENLLFEIRLGGRLPVMAHPERYLAIQDDPTRAEGARP
jgi:protein-tyrosine phosphatase